MDFGLLLTALAGQAYLFIPAMAWWGILLIVLGVILAIMVVLYIIGSKLQKKQMAQREQLQSMAQTVSMIIIDKKKMRMCDANLPKAVMEQTPKRFHKSKLPFVKAKIGPQIMTLIADQGIFDIVPVKKEIKGVVAGIYLTEIKGVRGGAVLTPDKDKKKKKKEEKK